MEGHCQGLDLPLTPQKQHKKNKTLRPFNSVFSFPSFLPPRSLHLPVAVNTRLTDEQRTELPAGRMENRDHMSRGSTSTSLSPSLRVLTLRNKWSVGGLLRGDAETVV